MPCTFALLNKFSGGSIVKFSQSRRAVVSREAKKKQQEARIQDNATTTVSYLHE